MSEPQRHDADTSVIMTCYNESRFIVDALRSVFAQTVADRIADVVVIDDGSTDGSRDLIEAFARTEPRVMLLRAQGGGVAAARNLALERVSGAYVAFLDGDDAWTADKLERQIAILDAHPTVGLVYADYFEFDDGRPERLDRCFARSYKLGHDRLLADYYLFDAPVIPSAMVVRKAVFDVIGNFNADMRVGEDTEFCLRVAERFAFHHVAMALAHKRRHAMSLSSRQDRLWPNHVLVTAKFAARNPALEPLARKRLARRAAKVGWGLVQVGERRHALAFLARSMRYNPWQARALIYTCLACVPRSVAATAHRLLSAWRRRAQVDGAS
jgi:glycosyltransferase involved in cell wall biosynthesis